MLSQSFFPCHWKFYANIHKNTSRKGETGKGATFPIIPDVFFLSFYFWIFFFQIKHAWLSWLEIKIKSIEKENKKRVGRNFFSLHKYYVAQLPNMYPVVKNIIFSFPGHLACSKVFTRVNSAVMDIFLHKSLSTLPVLSSFSCREKDKDRRPPALARPRWPTWGVPDYLLLWVGSTTGFLPEGSWPWPPPGGGGPSPAWMWGCPGFRCRVRFFHWIKREGKRDVGCSLKCALRGATQWGGDGSPTFLSELPCLFGNAWWMGGEMEPKGQGFP